MLQLAEISKKFGAVQALDGASLTMAPGEIRAFLGANGSGKSTMVKILSGLVQRDSGRITADGDKEIDTGNPRTARAQGIIAAYQDMTLIPNLSIAENIGFGHEKCRRFGLIDKHARWDLAERMIDLVRIPVSPDTLVEQLDPSLCSLVEFAKALTWNPKYLLIDEITASLYKSQVEHLFRLLSDLAGKGVSILFVSHRLDEVFSLCRTATILRSGRTVAELDLARATEDDLVFYMTGERPLSFCVDNQEKNDRRNGPLALECCNICVGRRVHNVSLRLSPGEIVGVAGLQGQGQAQFLRSIYGLYPMDSGDLYLNGKKVNLKSPAQAIREGIGFLPGDRQHEGIFPVRPISENIFVARDGIRNPLSMDSSRKNARNARSIIERLRIVAAGPSAPAMSLSGGNQQKLVVGRWLSMNLHVLILDDPTKGVDVSSRKEIHGILRGMTENGVSLLFLSSDNEELIEISDRIVVFFDGEIRAELDCDQMTPDRLASLTLGVTREGAIAQ